MYRLGTVLVESLNEYAMNGLGAAPWESIISTAAGVVGQGDTAAKILSARDDIRAARAARPVVVAPIASPGPSAPVVYQPPKRSSVAVTPLMIGVGALAVAGFLFLNKPRRNPGRRRRSHRRRR